MSGKWWDEPVHATLAELDKWLESVRASKERAKRLGYEPSFRYYATLEKLFVAKIQEYTRD